MTRGHDATPILTRCRPARSRIRRRLSCPPSAASVPASSSPPSIVGSGELIATTTLGAQVGYAALWIVLVSCAIKPVVQAELGRYTIVTGNTGLEGFNSVPGPRAGVSWLVWAWAITVTLTLLQVGGMYGGVGQVLHVLVPAVPVKAWVAVCLAVTLAVLLGGGYARIERFAMVKVGAVHAADGVRGRGAAAPSRRRVDGRPRARASASDLPPAGLVTAIAVFGITGVGATELVMYPYWCVEKGYARFVGPRQDERRLGRAGARLDPRDAPRHRAARW